MGDGGGPPGLLEKRLRTGTIPAEALGTAPSEQGKVDRWDMVAMDFVP